MKTRQKGNRIRRKVIERLRIGNFLVDVVEKTGRFQTIKDLFGLFDLVAMNEEDTYFIQVTCNRPHNHKLYLGFADRYKTEHRHIEQWVYYDRKGWTVFVYGKDRIQTIKKFK